MAHPSRQCQLLALLPRKLYMEEFRKKTLGCQRRWWKRETFTSGATHPTGSLNMPPNNNEDD